MNELSETTPLNVSSPDNGSVDSEDTSQSQRLWEELEQPWPSTFERSISLLASPVIQKTEAALYTKSPKPGSTPAALMRRRDLRRGFYTPEAGVVPPVRSGEDLSDRVDEFRKGVEKIKSLDFKAKVKDPRLVQQEQAKKAQAAKEYRAKLLKQQDEEAAMMSPGYDREKRAGAASKRSRMEEAEMMLHDGKSTLSQCMFNLANILMGVGLLGLPFSFKSSGWIGGLFCLAVFGLVTWRTSILIGRELNGDPRPSSYFDDSPFKSPLQPGSRPEARMLPPICSFPDIARVAFGQNGCFVLSVILYFELFSCICIFFVTIGDHLHSLFPSIAAATHVIYVGGVSMVPTIVLRTPALLSYLSMVGTFATIAVVLSVVASALAEGDLSEQVAKEEGIVLEHTHIWWNTSGLALSFGLVAYCFSGHAIVPSIYTSMKKPQEFETMVTYTYLVVLSACVAVGVAGYYMFGQTVLDQITLSLERSSQAAAAMRCLTWLMIMTGESNGV